MLIKRIPVVTLFVFILFNLSYSQNNARKNSLDEFTIRTGVNVSHWLSQSQRRGAEREKINTKEDFEKIAGMGFDHIRLPIDEEQMWDSAGNKHKEVFELMHNAIRWAFESKLRVIVDLHIIRSHYFNAESNELWTDPAEQQKLVNMWLQLQDELLKYPNDKLAYEILNEAVAGNPEDWNKLLDKVIREIRIKESSRKIVVGSNKWQMAETFPDLKIPENDENIILSFHFYSPMALTHHTAPWTNIAEYKGPVNYPGLIVDTANYKSLSKKTGDAMRNGSNGVFDKAVLEKMVMPAIRVAKKYNLPLYCGEFGVYPKIPEDVMLRWYRDMCEIFNSNKIAYCHWCYKGDFPVLNKDESPNKNLVSVLTAK
jgi:endoglucanase